MAGPKNNFVFNAATIWWAQALGDPPGHTLPWSHYSRPHGPDVFGGVVYGSQLWSPDPFDVETVHPEARAAFHRLLGRASSADAPPHGKTLLLLGEAGSGKTHLLRSFRTRKPHGLDLVHGPQEETALALTLGDIEQPRAVA